MANVHVATAGRLSWKKYRLVAVRTRPPSRAEHSKRQSLFGSGATLYAANSQGRPDLGAAAVVAT
jgi:hypothetical protein